MAQAVDFEIVAPDPLGLVTLPTRCTEPEVARPHGIGRKEGRQMPPRDLIETVVNMVGGDRPSEAEETGGIFFP